MTCDQGYNAFGYGGDRYMIYVEYPAEPITVYEIYDKMYFEEYVCLMASILSLWFGFDVIMFSRICGQIANKFHNIYINQTINIINNNNNNIHLNEIHLSHNNMIQNLRLNH